MIIFAGTEHTHQIDLSEYESVKSLLYQNVMNNLTIDKEDGRTLACLEDVVSRQKLWHYGSSTDDALAKLNWLIAQETIAQK